VVDEPRLVATRGGIDHRLAVGDEQEGVVVVRIGILVTLVRILVGNAVAEVLDQALALLDVTACETAVTMHGRVAHDEPLVVRFAGIIDLDTCHVRPPRAP
jgi:hypothetical protein